MLKTKVVILNWNGSEFLSKFLPKVRASVPEEVCVVVADNGSTDSSEEVVCGIEDIEWLPLGENYGFAEGYNRALEGMDGEVFVLLNSDVEPADGWLEPLVERLEAAPEVAAVQPKILSESNRRMFEYAGAAGGYIDLYGYPFCRGRIMNSVEEDRGQYDSEARVFWASGACLAIRAEAWRKAGGLDGAYFAHMEEIDLCWRLQIMGYGIEVCPQSVVYHVGGGTLPKSSPKKIYLNFRNSLAMLQKCLPEGEMWRLRRRRVMDWLSWGVYVLCGRWSFAGAVRRAHRDARRMRPHIEAERAKLWAQAVEPSPKTIYQNWVVLRYLIGETQFSQLRWPNNTQL
jgi:GT2 family glycosyltransferase